MDVRSGWSKSLPLAFAAVGASFIAVTALADRRMAGIDRASLNIAANAAPSIEDLSDARGQMLSLQLLMREQLDREAAGAPLNTAAIDRARHAMDQAIGAYLALPVFPGELERWKQILLARASFDDAVDRCLQRARQGDVAGALALSRGEVARSAGALGSAFTDDVQFNARHAHDLALEMGGLRSRSMLLAFALDAFCALITFAGGFVLYRALRAHDELATRHEQLLEDRASELEQFAGRIAHDILSPLATVGMALGHALPTTDDSRRARLHERGTTSLKRVQRLVVGLLEFARAGARPDPGARASLAGVLGDLALELQPAASEGGAELRVHCELDDAVACNPGVLTSIVANLARNAIKYIGDGPARRIEIRAQRCGEALRIEVEDTGPGLPPALQDQVFEPYVRYARGQAGIGLGLATVKRLAEGHGGRVGVQSVLGQGCTFWVELPRAPATSSDARPASPHAA